MVLQRLEGLSDREAVDRFTFDARWRYAAGVGGWDGAGRAGFAHTVLVDMRERLRRSDRPDRIFEVALTAARQAGLVGRRRVLDSTPLYDAVATMDTVTLIRSAIRGLLAVADPVLAATAAGGAGQRGRLRRQPANRSSTGTTRPPARRWSTPGPATATPCCACSRAAQDCRSRSVQAAALLATVLGQDLEPDDDGGCCASPGRSPRTGSSPPSTRRPGTGTRPATAASTATRATSPSTPTARSSPRPRSPPGNTGDVEPVADLIADLTNPTSADEPAARSTTAAVYGDAAYGAGEVLERLDDAGIEARTKVQPPVAPGGKFTKDRFDIDLHADTVTCPNGVTIAIRPISGHARHAGKADFGDACPTCPLRCAVHQRLRPDGSITIGRHEARLTAARARQTDPAWKADYRATRPKVERKIAHLMRRRHGGRRARMRGSPASPPTSPSSPPPPTSPDSPPSDSPTPTAAGPSTRSEPSGPIQDRL